MSATFADVSAQIDKLSATALRIKAERDALLAALREFEQLITRDSDDLGFHLRVVPIQVEAVARVRAAIAKAGGLS